MWQVSSHKSDVNVKRRVLQTCFFFFRNIDIILIDSLVRVNPVLSHEDVALLWLFKLPNIQVISDNKHWITKGIPLAVDLVHWRALMYSSNCLALLLTHTQDSCSLFSINTILRTCLRQLQSARREKQRLNYWTNQGPRLCIYMILVMRPLEIVPSVVERNKIFISSAVYVLDL